MPACRNCKYFDATARRCVRIPLSEPYDPSSTRNRGLSRVCVDAMMEQHLPLMTGRVLEIGPGVVKTPRRILAENGKAEWFGADPQYTRPTGNAVRAVVAKLPFPDAHFDHVFGFETIEHWEEHRETYAECMAEVARVTKPGGGVLFSAPIHMHGDARFVRGDLGKIAELFDAGSWRDLRFEEWRKDYLPLKPSVEWVYWQSGRNFRTVLKSSTQPIPSSWALEITATRV